MFLILQLCVEHVGQSCFASACVSLFPVFLAQSSRKTRGQFLVTVLGFSRFGKC